MSYSTKIVIVVVLLTLVVITTAQNQPLAFEVATIKPTPPDWRGDRFAMTQGAHQFVVRNYTLKYMIATAYSVTLRTISGGPSWIDSDPYDILATTPEEVRPSFENEMLRFRTLLADRFQLAFHTEQKEFSVYALTAAKNGLKLKESATPLDQQAQLAFRAFPGDFIQLPVRNATMAEFASMLQRAVLDRPVVDKTGLADRYDFDLEWTPDDSQFEGKMPAIKAENSGKPVLSAALRQLGLRLESTKGLVPVIVIHHVERPSKN